MKPRVKISKDLQRFFVDYFDDDSRILIDFFCHNKGMSSIAKDHKCDKRVIHSKWRGMVDELLHIIESIK